MTGPAGSSSLSTVPWCVGAVVRSRHQHVAAAAAGTFGAEDPQFYQCPEVRPGGVLADAEAPGIGPGGPNRAVLASHTQRLGAPVSGVPGHGCRRGLGARGGLRLVVGFGRLGHPSRSQVRRSRQAEIGGFRRPRAGRGPGRGGEPAVGEVFGKAPGFREHPGNPGIFHLQRGDQVQEPARPNAFRLQQVGKPPLDHQRSVGQRAELRKGEGEFPGDGGGGQVFNGLPLDARQQAVPDQHAVVSDRKFNPRRLAPEPGEPPGIALAGVHGHLDGCLQRPGLRHADAGPCPLHAGG